MITRSKKRYNTDLQSVKSNVNFKNKKNINYKYENELNKFSDNIESIYDGTFFERVPLEDQHDKLKEVVDLTDLKYFNKQLNKLRNTYKNSCPSIIDILKTDLPTNKKQELLEKVHLFTNSETLTPEYNHNLKVLNDCIIKNPNQKLIELEKEVNEKCNNYDSENDLKFKLLNSPMSLENKAIAYNRYKLLSSYMKMQIHLKDLNIKYGLILC